MFITAFSSISTLATLTVGLTEMLKSKLNLKKKGQKQLLSWSLPCILSIIGFVLGLGIFADFGTISSISAWIETIITGIGIGLTSNGIYEIDYVKDLLSYFKTIKLNK